MHQIYLAGRYSRRQELAAHAAELTALGHVVTSRWIDGDHQWSVPGLADQTESGFAANDNSEVPAEAYRFAQDDLEDVFAADVVVCFTEPPRTPNMNSRGGRHVEMGLALAWDKDVLVVGWLENVFCLLPEIEFCATWPEALAALAR